MGPPPRPTPPPPRLPCRPPPAGCPLAIKLSALQEFRLPALQAKADAAADAAEFDAPLADFQADQLRTYVRAYTPMLYLVCQDLSVRVSRDAAVWQGWVSGVVRARSWTAAQGAPSSPTASCSGRDCPSCLAEPPATPPSRPPMAPPSKLQWCRTGPRRPVSLTSAPFWG